MRRQAIPDQQHRTLLDFVQIAQELDECFVVVGARTQLEEQVRIPAIRLVASAPASDSRFQLNGWCSTGVWPRGAHVARTEGSSETPDSSSKMISAF
jgi:hypothetical protein